jgi:glycosyltransferase involved in cell wall biosynthesis
MNAGRPVIVSDEVGCQKNLVKNGVNGRVVREGDIEGLAEALRIVLLSRETGQEMGAESLRIINSYSFEQNVSGLRQALHALMPAFPLIEAS